jgi:hypothetical protein
MTDLIPVAILKIDSATKLPYLQFIKPFNFNPQDLGEIKLFMIKNEYIFLKEK